VYCIAFGKIIDCGENKTHSSQIHFIFMFTFRITTALTGTNIIQATDYDHARQLAENELYNIAIAHNTNYTLGESIVEGKYQFHGFNCGSGETWADNIHHAQDIAIDTEWIWANCNGNYAEVEATKDSVVQI
jgi:hypothetical protein